MRESYAEETDLPMVLATGHWAKGFAFVIALGWGLLHGNHALSPPNQCPGNWATNPGFPFRGSLTYACTLCG